jgi:hypothetical protein
MLDTLHPTARDYLALGTAFAVQTSLRSFCINSPFVFGNDLREVRTHAYILPFSDEMADWYGAHRRVGWPLDDP